MKISQFISMKRAFLGMRQKELAKAVGVSVRTIQRYESGESIPSPEVRARIHMVLGNGLYIPQKSLSENQSKMLIFSKQEILIASALLVLFYLLLLIVR